jgi:PST family polysaccharide transporter
LIRFLPPSIRAKLDRRPTLQRILANTSWLFADRIVRMGVGLLVGVWIARYLGPDQFGLFNYATAFVLLFGVFATLGLDKVVIRDLVHDPSGKRETLGTAFVLKVLGSGLALALAVGAIGVLRPGDTLIHWIVAIAAGGSIFQSFDVIDFWLQSQVESKYTVWARFAAFLLVVVIRVALILLQAPLIAFVFALLAETAFGAVGLMIAYRARGEDIRLWRASVACAKRMLGISWPLILSGMAITVYVRIDVVMLGQLVSDRAVGVYAAATRFSELWYFIPIAITSSVFPAIVEAKSIGEAEYQARLQKLFNLMAGLALAIAVPMTFLSDLVIRLFYKEAYDGAGPILAIHIWSALFVFLGVAQSPWDLTEGLTKLTMRRTLAGAVVNVALNLVLIPLYAGLGAAIATVVSYAVSSCLANALDRRLRPIFVLQMKSLFLLKYVRRAW